MALIHQCDRCGLCCEQLIIECDHLDAMREPAIAQKCGLLDGGGRVPLLEASWSVAVCQVKPCPFAGKDAQGRHTCSIYPTRPNVCVAFQAGSRKCQELRLAHGLQELPTVEVGGVLAEVRAKLNEAEEAEEEI